MTESQAHGAMLVRARIHPRALDHMTRYFDATASTVFVELIQNARRAGADRVDIVTQRTECAAGKETTEVAVWDNGRGIADPAVLLSFGESDWAGDLSRRERAAGMGLACLARRGCTVTSRAKSPSPEFATGWRMTLESDHFLGRTSAVAAPYEMAPEPCGTCVSFHATESLNALRAAAAYAAKYAPLTVSFNGRELERRDFLEGAIRTELWEGLTLAVIESSCLPNASSDLNFHGLPLNVRLPFVLTLNETIWSVRAEAVDCPELELVLPARKEAVENAFLERLREQARLAIYRALASMDPSPSVAFGDHARASAAGIELPEPPAELCPWVPPSAEAHAEDHASIGRFRPVGPDAIVVTYRADPPATHPFYRAARRENLAPRLFEANRRLTGYAWYDRLPRLTGVTVHVRADGAGCTLEALRQRLREARDNGAPFDPQVRVEGIVMTVEIARPDGVQFTCHYPADVVFLDASSGWLSDAEPVIAVDSDIDAEDLARLLRHAYFVPCRDIDADSYDTQSDRFDDEAMHMALNHVASPDEATRNAIARAVRQDIHWMFPKGRDVDILVRGEQVLVKLRPPQGA
ncbi:MAG: sensor histidine kinase [Gammaproteobacteria bacterium]|nr:sensor histidine kinase [Gammaproteobacteria bacterium]